MTRPFGMTRHAAQRIQEMCIPPQVVRECLESPERTHEVSRQRNEQDARYKGQLRTVYVRGRVGVVVGNDTRQIVTVLWMEDHRYSREDVEIWEEGGWIDY